MSQQPHTDTTTWSSFKEGVKYRLVPRQRPVWPNPQDSTGDLFPDYRIKGGSCFHTIGPVCELYQNELLPAIDKLLIENKEELERGESKFRSVGYGMYMVGSAPETTIPTIIIASLSVKKRTMIKALIKEEEILIQYPAIQVKTLNDIPAVLRALVQMDQQGINLILKGNLGLNFMECFEYVGGHIGIGSEVYDGEVIKTAGGIIYVTINEKTGRYGLTARHSAIDSEEDESATASNSSNDLIMDFDSDPDDFDPEYFLNEALTSKASISPKSETLSNHSSPSTANLSREQSNQSELEASASDMEAGASTRDLLLLDYGIFSIEKNTQCLPNKVTHPKTKENVRVKEVARYNRGGHILSLSYKVMQGEIQMCPYMLQMPGWSTFQEVWIINLNAPLVRGHSGTWVVDAESGNLYGHVVASRPGSRTGFVLPAWKIFNDIEKNVGGIVSLTHPEVEQTLPTDLATSNQAVNDLFSSRMNTPRHEGISVPASFTIPEHYRSLGYTEIEPMRPHQKHQESNTYQADHLDPLVFVSSSPDQGRERYRDFGEGSPIILGIFENDVFYCQHLSDCQLRFSNSSELEDHFESAHLAFTRIQPAVKYICLQCQRTNKDAYLRCMHCHMHNSIQTQVQGRFIRNPNSLQSPYKNIPEIEQYLWNHPSSHTGAIEHERPRLRIADTTTKSLHASTEAHHPFQQSEASISKQPTSQQSEPSEVSSLNASEASELYSMSNQSKQGKVADLPPPLPKWTEKMSREELAMYAWDRTWDCHRCASHQTTGLGYRSTSACPDCNHRRCSHCPVKWKLRRKPQYESADLNGAGNYSYPSSKYPMGGSYTSSDKSTNDSYPSSKYPTGSFYTSSDKSTNYSYPSSNNSTGGGYYRQSDDNKKY